MNVIIVGAGKVGRAIAEELNNEGHNICIIDTNGEILQDVSTSLDIMGIVGNGASHTVQLEAGVAEADLLIAVTTSDELNLLACLIAKKAGNCDTIARVRNPIYFQEMKFLKEELELSMIINPERAAAAEIARLLRFPSAVEIDAFASGRVELLRFKIPENSILDNRKIYEIVTKLNSDVLVCTVERNEEVVIPDGNFELHSSDVISIIAEPAKTNAFFRKIGLETNQVKDTMIVGGGTIAYYLAKQLSYMGIEVTIIEKNKKRCEELSALLPEVIVINGDGTSHDVLLEEGIAHVESFVSLTNIDEENIILSLCASTMSDAKLVTKVNRIDFEGVVEKLDLGSVIHPKHITADLIIQYVRAMQNASGNNVETLYSIIGGKAEALAFKIKDASDTIIGVTFEKMNIKKNLLICCIVRDGLVIIPRGKDYIKSGDTVIVVTTVEGLTDIHDILA